MVSENFEIVIALASIAVGAGLIWMARTSPN